MIRAFVCAAFAAGLLLTAPAAAQELPAVEGSPGFDPSFFVNKGDAYNCADFKSQAEAQAVLRADPSDPNQCGGEQQTCRRHASAHGDPGGAGGHGCVGWTIS
jgi:hypothetical protein